MLPMMLLTPRLLVTVAVLLMVADGARGHKPPGKKIPHPTTLVEEPGKTGSRDHERTGSYGGSRTTGTRGNEGTGSYGVQNHPEFDFSSDRENTPIEEEWKDSSVFLSIFDELLNTTSEQPQNPEVATISTTITADAPLMDELTKWKEPSTWSFNKTSRRTQFKTPGATVEHNFEEKKLQTTKNLGQPQLPAEN
ncbi:uncharacterized protein LOC132952277 isoform X1 [Metopolophium dirhodum]|uniref:uncharacterized protein LOC132952277 isoform X1 n=1 Tax=Metopolophium dirhodum TaxID=44670 RepID=UPI00298F8B88|nr:uncharacterized protein LOC132952277 isoform X1 [Metopolophium dirhodum]